MAKLSISNIFEASKLKATKAGAELSALLDTFSQLVKEIVPALSNGLTFGDNLNCEPKVVGLTSDTDQVVATASGKVVTDVLLTRVLEVGTKKSAFGWWLNDKGELVVNADFVDDDGDPTTDEIDCRLLIFYA